MIHFTLISYEHKYILITFPKSGCTLIRRLFIELNKEHLSDLMEDYGSLSNHYVQRYFDLTQEDLATKYIDYKIICVYRETYGRVASMFFNKFAGIYDEALEEIPGFRESYYRISAKIRTFRKFVNWLRNRKHSDAHYDEQILPDWIKPHKVIEIADVNKLFTGINDKVGVESNKILKKIGRVNSLKKNRSMKGMYADYDFKDDPLNLDVQKNGVPEYHMMYDQPLMDKVRTIYKKEIEYYANHS